MNYNVKGTNLLITPEVRAYLEKRLNQLDKLMRDKQAARTDVELEYLRDEERMFRAELMLNDPKLGGPVRAEARGAGLHESIDIAVQDLARELRRGKKMRIHGFRRSAAKLKDFLRGFGRG